MNALVIQATYTSIEIGLFAVEEDELYSIATSVLEKQKSAQLLSTIDQLLNRGGCSLADISFCAVNRGPAPFTTLRTVIATVNGLKAVTPIKLIGVDGLAVLAEEYKDEQSFIFVSNAFAGDLYFYTPTTPEHTGYAATETVIETIVKNNIKKIAGNGSSVIEKYISDHAIKTSPVSYVDIEKGTPQLSTIAQYAHRLWKKDNANCLFNTFVQPLYLKEYALFK
ncbi:tRNA (adenosine(37)-N6)-threonylcarbamoyltransferase complex dimerization subunit type 1 TsaB [bacterium]|nr:MAG: tRNA (adenosine(37)-N6)-threonylcarbamoyltransferase complex dimerization subunit type 1 TsaB [bacterium]QQR62077.1 MAG: tRNA (adenosine(37)-N6)-threonylcarbamoyltransferase complex dimerization subunit type 1 TsaB [bacterium]QQR63368.1 MAG: tRNA (adenosine(37)-N6)-threonylcarbamoyltransferase complex dimerization subunit type 1 TsaB [bacterium]